VQKYKAGFNLMPSESKKLIGMGICALPEVKKAFKEGIVYVKSQTTNYWVLRTMMEWAGFPGEPKDNYVCGVNFTLGACGNSEREVLHWDRYMTRLKGQKPAPLVMPQYAFEKGKAVCVQGNADPWVFRMQKSDVYIGGANAIDPNGDVAIQCRGGDVGTVEKPRGGSIQRHLPYIERYNIPHIVAVGLEKMIPVTIAKANAAAPMNNIPQGAKFGAESGEFIYFDGGTPCGLLPMKRPPARPFTEIDAIKVLTGCDATPWGAGAILGGEGSIQLILEGTREQIDKAIDIRAGEIGFRGVPMPGLKLRDCSFCTMACLHSRQHDLIAEEFKRSDYAKQGLQTYPWLGGRAAKYRAKPVYDPQKGEWHPEK